MQAPEIGRLVAEQVTPGRDHQPRRQRAAAGPVHRRGQPATGSAWCSEFRPREKPMYPLLQADPARSAWIETTVAELRPVRRAAPRRARRRQPGQAVPARAVPRVRQARLPRPARPGRPRRPGRRRRRVRGHQRGGRPARPGLRPDRRAGAALAAGLGHRRAEGPVAARHRDRRGGVLRVDQREERRLVVQGHGGDRDQGRRRLAAHRRARPTSTSAPTATSRCSTRSPRRG